MNLILKNATLILNERETIQKGNLYIEGNIIRDISENDLSLTYKDADCIDLSGQYVLPGLIDTHIHGALNHDAIDGSQETVDAISQHVVKDGCTAFLASLTVISHERMLEVLRLYKDVKQPEKGARFLGIHEEGPYLNVAYKALMDERYLRNPSIRELDEMIEASGNRIVTMTVAPELEGMEEFIRYATDKGITIMMGHSDARTADVQMALGQGAKGYTHLYNSCSQHLHRDPGLVSGALLDQNGLCELIGDGYHIHDDVIRITYNYLQSRRIVLVTDAMLGKGMPDGEYVFSNLRCQKEGTHVWVKETGRRAGSAFGMIDAVRYMMATVGCSLNDIVAMACMNPAVLAQVADRKGQLKIGMDADICVLNHRHDVTMTIVEGEVVYRT